jgi:hypothetical protein
MSRRLKNAGWIAAFVALCAIWGHEVMHAVRQQSHPHANTGVWICPILGNCGPAGTPGLGRWDGRSGSTFPGFWSSLWRKGHDLLKRADSAKNKVFA